MIRRNKEKDDTEKSKKTHVLSSEDVANAHAAGDGATGRSKEAITEEDIHPKKEDEKPEPGSADTY